MNDQSKEEKNSSPSQQAQMPPSEVNTPQLLQHSISSKPVKIDPINAIIVLVTATVGGGQILVAGGRFGLLGTITGLLLLGILLVYGGTTYNWQQSLVYSAAVGLSILQIFGFLFNNLFDESGFFFQMNRGDFLAFGFWLIVTFIIYLFRARYVNTTKVGM